MLDEQGRIQEAFLSNAVSAEESGVWRGRSWVDTVDDISSKKVLRMVGDAVATGVSAFRQVNQHFPSGTELPMEYTVVRLGGEGGLMAIGRNPGAFGKIFTTMLIGMALAEGLAILAWIVIK